MPSLRAPQVPYWWNIVTNETTMDIPIGHTLPEGAWVPKSDWQKIEADGEETYYWNFKVRLEDGCHTTGGEIAS